MPDTLHNFMTAMPTPQVKTWDDLAQAACAAYNKAAVQHDEEGLACHALSWAELDPGGQACWLAVVHQLWAEYVALRALTARQFHLGAGDAS